MSSETKTVFSLGRFSGAPRKYWIAPGSLSVDPSRKLSCYCPLTIHGLINKHSMFNNAKQGYNSGELENKKERGREGDRGREGRNERRKERRKQMNNSSAKCKR